MTEWRQYAPNIWKMGEYTLQIVQRDICRVLELWRGREFVSIDQKTNLNDIAQIFMFTYRDIETLNKAWDTSNFIEYTKTLRYY